MYSKLISLISTDSFESSHGLRSISAYLKAHGHTTFIFFMRSFRHSTPRLYSEDVLADLQRRVSNSDLIGISCLSQNAEKAIQVINFLKPFAIPIVWGGVYATLNPETCLQYTNIVCIGEGEEAMLELVESLNDKSRIKIIKNLWVKENGHIYKNELRPLITNLDKLPLEDYDFSKQFVLTHKNCIAKFSNSYLKASNLKLVLSSLNLWGFSVMTSRGCPFACFFCYSYDFRKLYGNDSPIVRRKSVEAAISELIYRKQNIANLNFIVFDDNEFFSRPLEEIRKFSVVYKEKINLPFACYLQFATFDEEKLKLLMDCGLYIVVVGIQSASERINTKIYRRSMPDRSRCLEIAKRINQYQDKILPPAYQIISTNPYETDEDVWKNIQFVRALPKPFRLRVFHLAFFPGSSIAKKAMADGIVKSQKGLCYQTSYFNSFFHFGIKKRKGSILYSWFLLDLLTGLHAQKKTGLVSERTFALLTHKKIVSFFSKNSFAVFPLRYLLLFKSYFRLYAFPWFLKGLDLFFRRQRERKSYQKSYSVTKNHHTYE